MANIFYQYVIPNLLFFVVIFLIFTIAQAVIVLFLQWLEHKNHDRLMALALKSYKHYRKIQLIFRLAGILLIILAILIILPYFDPNNLKPETTIFAGFMLLVITVVYFIVTNLKGKFSIRKRGDKIIYVLLSLILYIFILFLIDQKLPNYRIYVYNNMVNPVIAGIVNQSDANQQEQLLNQFRDMAKTEQCTLKNYKNEKYTGVIHNFLYVATDADLKIIKGPMLPHNNDAKIKGRNCTNGKETFLLTDYGEWYWVIDTTK